MSEKSVGFLHSDDVINLAQLELSVEGSNR